jgi:hypothetical protein
MRELTIRRTRKKQRFLNRKKSISKNNKTYSFFLKGGKKNKNTLKPHCSPCAKLRNKRTKRKFGSCLSDKALLRLKDIWNLRHSDKKINTNEPAVIWRELNHFMKNTCNQEACWLRQSFVKGDLKEEIDKSFVPAAPKEWKKNPNEWLSSWDIIKVMRQYEDAYSCFEFLGPTPIDFDKKKMEDGKCVWDELCHFNLFQQIKKKKTKIGIIFNTDPHTKSGQHWISLFINIKKRWIFFFDSVGDKPPNEINVFVKRIQEQADKLGFSLHYDINKTQHQHGDTECGVYSLFFIIHMLEDSFSTQYLKTHKFPDKEMQKFRSVYFTSTDVLAHGGAIITHSI